MQLSWQWKNFNALTTLELYRVLQLRAQIFVVEQNDIYLDPDDKDLEALHLLGWDQHHLASYARIVPPTAKEDDVSFGRVAVAESYRGTGIAHTLIQQTLDKIQQNFPTHPIKITAQAYLIKFYEKFGFKTEGEIFLEGTIPHIHMIKKS